MVEKNDFTIYRKYEGDEKYCDYNFDQIKKRLLEVAKGLMIEDKIEEYIDDMEYITEQIADELSETISDLEDLQQDYNDLEEEKEDLEREIEELEEEKEELED